MLPERFLSYYADPFSRSELVYGVVAAGEHTPMTAKHSELCASGGLFCTYNSAQLIDALRVRGLPPLDMLDIRHALQLACGRPKRSFVHSDFSFLKWLRFTNLSRPECELYLALIDGRAEQPKSDSLETLLLRTCAAMRDVWMGISQELERLGEFERFVRFEVPVQTLMSKRQWRGISVNVGESASLLAQAKAEKYKAMLEVGAILKVNPTGLNYRSVLPYLDGTDAAVLQTFSESQNLASHFKLAASESHLARRFRSMVNENRNIKALLALTTSNGRVFPVLDTMATVTARIQTSMPNLQQIRKAYRGALQVDDGMHDIYLDFSQFEPGILAQFVGPGPYRDLYNAGDVYKELAQAIFGDTSKRELAKQVFIAFCYGMDLTSIARLLGDAARADGSSVEAIGRFFSQFPELLQFKQACEVNLQKHGFISTALGNRRVRIRSGPLSRREKGWAMNQAVQGTGSLILKNTLLRLAARFGDDSILLPMHDAVWIQLAQRESGSMDAVAQEAIALMESVAREWCPEVRLRVKATPFAEAPGATHAWLLQGDPVLESVFQNVMIMTRTSRDHLASGLDLLATLSKISFSKPCEIKKEIPSSSRSGES